MSSLDHRTANKQADRKIVTFSLGHQTFGIDMHSLIEIREWEEPTPLPTVPSFIKGVTNLRGNVVPVIGLAERLGWEPSKIHARSCVLVVSIGEKQAGFLVDEVSDIVSIGDQEIQPHPMSKSANRASSWAWSGSNRGRWKRAATTPGR